MISIVGYGGDLRTWSGGKPSSHKLDPSGVLSGLYLFAKCFRDEKMKTGSSEQPSEKDLSTLLGQILVELGYITVYQLDESLQIQKESDSKGEEHQTLGAILLELGYCSPNQLIRGIQVQVEYRKASAPKS